jgi:MFS family permease
MNRPSATQATSEKAAAPSIAFAGFLTLAVAMGIGRFAFTPLLPMMEGDSGLTVAAGGWLAAANYLGYFVGALAAVALRLSPATAIRGGLIATGLTTVAMGFFDGFAAWLLLRALAGVASAWAMISASAWCLDALARRGQSGFIGLVFGGVGAGIAFAGLVCAASIAANASSGETWIVLGVFALGGSAAVWPALGVVSTLPGARSGTMAIDRSRRWDGEVVRLALCYGAFGMAYIVPATFLPAMAKAALGDPTLFRWSWPIFGAAALVGTVAAGRWRNRIGNRRLWSISHLVMAAGVMAPLLPLGFAGIALGSLTIGGSFMAATMAAIGEARAVGGAHAERLIAIMTAAFAIGQIVGPLAVSALVGRGGTFAPALLAASGLFVVSAVALLHKARSTATIALSSGGGD